MVDFSALSIPELLDEKGFDCACGRHHSTPLKLYDVRRGAIEGLPAVLRTLGMSHPFVLCDRNTKKAAWAPCQQALEQAGIPYQLYVFEQSPEPDEQACGSLLMAFDPACDGVLAVGSGVLNDLGKVLAHATGRPQAVVATAPSMDGYASDSSSLIRGGVKVTLYNACPGAVIADTDILCNAPERMLQAGLGDMLAKYISVLEWRMSELVNGEYYCENIASLMRHALERIVENAPRLLSREPEAVESIFEGLTLSGIAMSFAKVSRPASGLEHYFSHLWEMMALMRHKPQQLHGIQVGVGSLITLRVWQRLAELQPDRERALKARAEFDQEAWEAMIRRIFGSIAPAILSAAEREGRNDAERHRQRVEIICSHWQEILDMAREELPSYQAIYRLMSDLHMPLTPEDIGFSHQDMVDAFLGSREIRDKYLSSSLIWDLGLMYDQAEHWLAD